MTQQRSRDDVIQQDIKDLHQLGYAQELFRSMGGFSNFAISFSIISILTGAVILYDYGLAWAGTAAVLIGWPLVGLLTLVELYLDCASDAWRGLQVLATASPDRFELARPGDSGQAGNV